MVLGSIPKIPIIQILFIIKMHQDLKQFRLNSQWHHLQQIISVNHQMLLTKLTRDWLLATSNEVQQTRVEKTVDNKPRKESFVENKRKLKN